MNIAFKHHTSSVRRKRTKLQTFEEKAGMSWIWTSKVYTALKPKVPVNPDFSQWGLQFSLRSSLEQWFLFPGCLGYVRDNTTQKSPYKDPVINESAWHVTSPYVRRHHHARWALPNSRCFKGRRVVETTVAFRCSWGFQEELAGSSQSVK